MRWFESPTSTKARNNKRRKFYLGTLSQHQQKWLYSGYLPLCDLAGTERVNSLKNKKWNKVPIKSLTKKLRLTEKKNTDSCGQRSASDPNPIHQLRDNNRPSYFDYERATADCRAIITDSRFLTRTYAPVWTEHKPMNTCSKRALRSQTRPQRMDMGRKL